MLVAEVGLGKEAIDIEDMEYVADTIFALRHRIERDLLIREMEIRRAREAPIDVAKTYFSIVEGCRIKIVMSILLEEIPTYDIRELYIGCSMLQKSISHIHNMFSIYRIFS